jgi:Cd2+/Zn2+-exporting ATPase
VAIGDLLVGETIVVKPGERIPMDGLILSGASYVNQAPITGESQLISKQSGDEVFASSVNGEGTLEIAVTHLASDNTISRLIKMVEEAQERRAPVQRFVDRFARYYTPIVVTIAALVAILPPLLWGGSFWNPDADTQGWLYRALALLVVACPCALVISTPVSIVSAIANGARNGIVFKGGAHLERLSLVKAIAFDKTGTLTKGEPRVVAVRSIDCTTDGMESCDSCDDLVALASAVEQRSEHPLAYALTAESRLRDVHGRYPTAEGVMAMTGQGVKGTVNGRQVTIGNHAYFDAHVPHPDHCQIVSEADREGYTTILVSQEVEYAGFLTIADEVRDSSLEAILALKAQGIESLVMITGDNDATAQRVAENVGVTDVRANCMPQDKVLAVKQLSHEHGPVAMVGDGINDTPALATASVGIAVGRTAQAMEMADIALMSDDLRQLPFAVELSRAVMRTIRVNVALSLGIKLIFLILVISGLGSMWMAVFADMGTSLLVTLNGTRLLRHPSPPSRNLTDNHYR